MFKRSLKNTILLNVGAFLLVALLEALSIWIVKDKYESDYAFFAHVFNYAFIIMVLIWINHFVLIPFLLDKRRYILYGLMLVGSIFLTSCIKAYGKNWELACETTKAIPLA